eukprot:7542827-Alexandrium_andersonii.AAC.1
MSASLVGSEMCIRDSSRRVVRYFVRLAGQLDVGTASPRGWRPPWSAAGPVSYTHLTLPTICSV